MVSRRARQPRSCEPTLKIIAMFLSSSDSRWWFILFNLPILIVCPIAELDAAETEESAEPLPKEWYVSGFLMRSYPIGSTLKFDGDKIPDTSFDSATGGGLKIGVFPSYKSVFGAEVEVSGHGGSITAPQTVVGDTVRSAQLDTTRLNFMVNALARYPGDYIQPYTGVGLGLAIILTDGQTQSSSGIRETESLSGLTLQGIIGARLIITDHLFGFAEYKPALFFWGKEDDGCGSGKYRKRNCIPRPIHSLDSQSHYVSVGIGYRF
ncbi:MAG: porin family protein [Nitrospira sp. CG24B]|nr:MAG: porin family protein [Nitrospira sp. CG24B]